MLDAIVMNDGLLKLPRRMTPVAFDDDTALVIIAMELAFSSGSVFFKYREWLDLRGKIGKTT